LDAGYFTPSLSSILFPPQSQHIDSQIIVAAAIMPGFADSFWTPDYATGLGILYGKLQQGIAENQQILTIANLRADAEEAYGSRVGDIAPSVDRITSGFSKDEGASVRKVCIIPHLPR
jgi:hypothetical protein